MRLVAVEKDTSPLLAGFMRVSGTIRFDGSETETIWFDLPSDQETSINDQGDPWAVLLMPEAAIRGETLEMDLQVDPVLIDNLRGLHRLWQSWYGFIRPTEIIAPKGKFALKGTETAQFFSGGVDSFFSLNYGAARPEFPSVKPTSSLLTLWGCDVPLSNPDAFESVRTLAEDTARLYGMDCVPIASNMTSLKSSKLYWGSLTYGSCFVAAGQLLSGRFQNLVFASSLDLGTPEPEGSNPLADPLLSSSQLRVIHQGAAFKRIEKTEFIASDPQVLSRLRVCWAMGEATNCSRCEKCLRTMGTLDLLGVKDQATSFDWSSYSPGALAKVYLPSPLHAALFREIGDTARSRGRDDLAKAITKSLRRSFVLRYAVVKPAKRIWSLLSRFPGLEGYVMPLRRFLSRQLLNR